MRTFLDILESYLSRCDISVEIYIHDLSAPDNLYSDFKAKLLSLTIEELAESTGLRRIYVERIRKALDNTEIRSLSHLATVKGIGSVSLEKSFQYFRVTSISSRQKELLECKGDPV
jgi:uncharacterized protein YnzC (UPF0291/DUF896 family)